MDQIEAALIIEKQALESLTYKVNDFLKHPIRLIQASKSLIGLDLDNPNKKLLRFNSDYLDNNKYQKFDNRNFIVNDLNEVINIHDLEKAFLDNDKDKVFEVLNHVSKVSSSLHILEYLIEISLKQSGNSFLIIWSIYRIIFFIDKKEVELFIDLSIDSIFEDKFENLDSTYSQDFKDIINFSNLSVLDIDLFSHLLELNASVLVRSDKIQSLIAGMISRKFDSNKNATFNFESQKLEYVQLLKIGRPWLLDFLNKIDKNKITIELILFLDSIRCLFKFLDKKYYKSICVHFERLVKVFNV